MQRLSSLKQHFASTVKDTLYEKNPDDVVIVAAYRTPLTKAGKGGLKDTSSADILALLLEGVLKKTDLRADSVEDITVGNVCNPGAGALEHRAATIIAGFPVATSLMAVNRQCSSGLMAINDIANKITAGQISIGIGAGVESMSQNYGSLLTEFPSSIKEHEVAKNCLIPMGITSENVASKFGISRRDQDLFAAKSFAKASAAQKAGLFTQEIIPITVKVLDENGNPQQITVSKDDGIRENVTADSLSKLKPAFSKNGCTHAGNASQITDGAGVVVLMRRSTAEKLGHPILAKYVHCKVVGVDPEIMGIGPAVAIPVLLEDVGISTNDVDIFELNEAFASQAVFCIKHLKLDPTKVNPKGGAIAIGHPLGATGARQFATLITELQRTGQKIGVTSMCIGTGMGAASLIVRE